MSNKDFWLFKKHEKNIDFTNFNDRDLIDKIASSLNIKLATEKQSNNTRLDWSVLAHQYHFYYDYIDSDEEISKMLFDSEINSTENVFIEMQRGMPVISTTTNFFIQHWYDLTCSLVGMGCIVVTNDFKYLMEFTDDAYAMLYSNFKIKS